MVATPAKPKQKRVALTVTLAPETDVTLTEWSKAEGGRKRGRVIDRLVAEEKLRRDG